MTERRLHFPATAALLILAGCSGEPAPAKPAEAPKPAPAAVTPASTPPAAPMEISPRRYTDTAAPGSPAAVDSAPPTLALRLIGIVTIGGRRVATFSDGSTVYTVGPGDPLGSDFKLVSIDDEKTVFFHQPTGREWQWKTAQFRGEGAPVAVAASGSNATSPAVAPPAVQAPAAPSQRPAATVSSPNLPGTAQLPPDAPPSLFQPMSPANPTIPSSVAPPQGIGTSVPANVVPPQGTAPVYPRQVTPQGGAPKAPASRP